MDSLVYLVVVCALCGPVLMSPTETRSTDESIDSNTVPVIDEQIDATFRAAEPLAAGQLRLAENCDPEQCKLPNCRCASTELNETIAVSETPQLVMLTFDDAVTALNYEYIQQKINGRVNPDGCPVAATFYVSHEWTDYSKVHKLWAAGHEIALHSITHNYLSAHWRKASVAQLVEGQSLF